MNLPELGKALGVGTLEASYLIAGPEALLRDEAIHLLRAAVLGDGPVDFNLDRLDGERTSAADLEAALGTLPMLAERRLVWLREPVGPGGRMRAALGDALTSMVPGLQAGGPVVLVVTAATADRRASWVKTFAARVDCTPPKDRRGQLAFCVRRRNAAVSSSRPGLRRPSWSASGPTC